jgi:hypothetical protein
VAVSMRLVPRTMRGKQFLKRLFFGRLSPIPPEIEDGLAPYSRPVPMGRNAESHQFKVLYALARVRGGRDHRHQEYAYKGEDPVVTGCAAG